LNISPDGEGDYTWYEGLWWNSTVSPRSDIAASDSILTLDWKSGQGTSDTDVSACSPNGQYCHAFRYGYFEARMKWDPATGSWPAFWLLPAEDITGLGVSNNESGEIDIFEGQGATPHTYFGTIHDWKDYVDIANNENTNAYELASTVDVTQYHTYGILWVPGTITWYFDNELLFSAATYEIFDQEYFYPILSSQEGADWTYGDMTGVTASSIPLNVDWIHVWQK
jgi:beta-glucanase (GH16 family)